VLEVKVHAGDPVKTGQLLATIDAREVDGMVRKSEAGLQEALMAQEEVEKGLQAARANLDLGNATLQRYQNLWDKKSVSQQEFDEVQARQRMAAAQVEAMEAKKRQVQAKMEQAHSDIGSSKALRSYAEIRSPLNGVVVQRQAEPGSLAVPGMPLLVVEETGRFRLEVAVEESRIQMVKLGQKIPVKVAAAQSDSFLGIVGEIQPAGDPASRTYLVKINLPAISAIRSGMYGEASFEDGSRRGIWAPPRSVVRQGQLEGVFVVDAENRARLRLLKLGEESADGIEVLAGLEAGERLVVEGTAGLKDGSPVEVAR
jgi:RND family efflux transporter MFP subunit